MKRRTFFARLGLGALAASLGKLSPALGKTQTTITPDYEMPNPLYTTPKDGEVVGFECWYDARDDCWWGRDIVFPHSFGTTTFRRWDFQGE